MSDDSVNSETATQNQVQVVAEDFASRSKPIVRMDINTRVNISLAIQRYKRAEQAFEHASTEFGEACRAVRNLLPDDAKFVTRIDHEHYLVTRAKDGFEVTKVESL